MSAGPIQNQQRTFRSSPLWLVPAVLAAVALGAIVPLPLPWKDQAIFGAVLMGVAVVLSLLSRAPIVTLALMGISLFSTLRYGYWRVTQTWDGITSAGHIHQWDTFFVLILLFAEFYAFATLILGYFQTLRPLRRAPVPLPRNQQRWPTVDVYIPTYNESLDVVRATVLGALSLDYPSDKLRIYVLDDGRRKEFAEFSAGVGVGYITRTNNAHAKAGNINHALGRTSGELIAIFDSDHIPTRSFLQATLGWFLRDRRIAMVQTPHHFYSPDPFERNLGQFRKIPNEGELFHRLVQDGNDLWNASFFCGSCAVLRREALQEIGGIAVETVTEDAHTALRMHERGWRTAYINVPQAAGLATETLAAHIGQRIRWARGMVQILRTENPLFIRGLSFAQRLCYFNATTHFLFAVPRLIFLLIPLVYLLLGMVNIYGYSLAVFAYALPHIVLSNLTNSRIQGRYRFSFWNEIYEAVLAPYILFPTLLALINPRLGKFNVTAKGGVIRKSFFDRRIALPFLFLLALNFLGLFMAERRWVTDPFHHDTILMNSVWTVYNIVILSVAASVAWERKQRRSQVRVNVHTRLVLSAHGLQPIAGVTSQLSAHGAMVRLANPPRLPRGAPVVVALEAAPSYCEIAARVVHSGKHHVRLTFSQLSAEQERCLVNLIYCRPEAWVTWHRSRGLDRPLLSLAQIFWLAARGLGVVAVGLFTSRPSEQPKLSREQSKGGAPAVAAGVLIAVLAIFTPMRAVASDAATNTNPSQPPPSTAPAAAFHDVYQLTSLGQQKTLGMSGAGAEQRFFLDMPLTKVITEATLDVSYNAPLLRTRESRLEIWLNGTHVGSVPLNNGNERISLSLPADLLTSNNTLTLQLQGYCAACRRGTGPWVTVAPGSELRLSGTRLPLANDLALLPLPFFDPAVQHSWTLPFVFSGTPETQTSQAAAAVASWFGVFSDFRGVHFPITVGELPQGNAVLFALRDSPLAATLSLPSRPGGLVAMRDNPRDPYGKLLVIAGDQPQDLLTAARFLVTRNNAQVHTDAASVASVRLPPAREYNAPRWLDGSKPSQIGTYTTAERLTLNGSGSVNIYFRLPPDLFLQARDSVPLLLKFSYAGVADNAAAALHVRLNDQAVESIRLRPASANVDEQETVRLPTGRLQPYTNTLTIDVDFGHAPPPKNVWQYAAIHRESTIDLGGLPHSVVLPRLELFADSGYPFTAFADLSRTAVVLPETPSASDYETLLDMMGFFGAQTGAPATDVSVTDADHIKRFADKDLVVVGSVRTQPLYSQWAPKMPLNVARGIRLTQQAQPSRFLHPEWPFRSGDRQRLHNLLASGASLDLVVEDFVSPLHRDRSVVTIVPQDETSTEVIAAMFTPSLDKGPIYGGVSVARRGWFESFLVGDLAYRAGETDALQRATIFFIQHYLIIPPLLLLLTLLVAIWTFGKTERVAAERLDSQRRAEVSI